MNLSHIPDAELERLADPRTQAEYQAERLRRRQQTQAIEEMEHYLAQAAALNERLDQLVGEYKTRYEPLAASMAANPEPRLIPELTSLYSLTELIRVTTLEYIQAALFSGLITDPLLVDLRGKPLRGQKAIITFLNSSRDFGRGFYPAKVSDELLKRAGRRDLYSFPEPYDSRLAVTQRELLATAILASTGKR